MILPDWIEKLPEPARAAMAAIYRAVMAAGRDAGQAAQVAQAALTAQFEAVGDVWQPRTAVTAAESSQAIRFRAAQAATDPSGLVWEAVLIAPGISQSDPMFYWGEEVLEAAAAKFVGVDINAYELTADFFAHLPIPNIGLLEDVKRYLVAKKVGVIEKAWYAAGVGIMGRIHFLPEQAWLPRTIQHGIDSGAGGAVLGLSIDARVSAIEVPVEGYRVMWATKIVSASSVDVVTRPAAGGKFIRAIMGLNAQQEESMNKAQLLALILKVRPDLLAGKDAATLSDAEVLVIAQQAMVAKTDDGQQRAAQAAGLTADQVKEMLAAGLKETEQRAACARVLDGELSGCNLPELAKARVRGLFDGKVFEKQTLDAAIKTEKEYLAAMAVPGFDLGDQARVGVGLGTMDKIQAATDRLLGITGEDRVAMAKMTRLDGQPVFADLRAAQAADVAGLPAISGIRELYVLLTGDSEIQGIFNRRALPADLRAAQGLDSGTFSYALGNTLNRRIIKDYREPNFHEDLLISVRKPVANFKTQEAVNIGYPADLPAVDPETGDYQDSSPGSDEEATYSVGQKGRILKVTRKTIINDDVSIVQRYVAREGRAARRTHAKYVWGFAINNSNCSDGTAWFTVGHGNLGTTALDFAPALVAYLALAKMTEMGSGERIGLLDDENVKPVLVYPVDLMATGEKIVEDEFYYSANDLTTKTRNSLKGKIRGVKLSLLTDANDWYMFLPSTLADMVEMGYLNGRQEPEFFLADSPQSERVFLGDEIRYKIRFEFGGTPVDFRPGYKSAVAP